MCTQPTVGARRPLTTFRVVDLPAPFGPSRAKTLPAGITNDTPWSTSMRPGRATARTPRPAPDAAVTLAWAPPSVTVKIWPLPVFHDTTSEPAVTEVVASFVSLVGWLRVSDVPDFPSACCAIWLAAAFA